MARHLVEIDNEHNARSTLITLYTTGYNYLFIQSNLHAKIDPNLQFLCFTSCVYINHHGLVRFIITI